MLGSACRPLKTEAEVACLATTQRGWYRLALPRNPILQTHYGPGFLSGSPFLSVRSSLLHRLVQSRCTASRVTFISWCLAASKAPRSQALRVAHRRFGRWSLDTPATCCVKGRARFPASLGTSEVEHTQCCRVGSPSQTPRTAEPALYPVP